MPEPVWNPDPPATMRALRLHAVGDLRLDTVPTPRPNAGSVLVRVEACGVCGSDIPRIFARGTYRFPTIPGHEFAGVVAAAGPGAGRWSVGDRVAVFPLLWCGRCAPCEQGRYVMCEDYDYLGSRCDGGFAEYVCAPERNLVGIPDSVSMACAAMVEPTAVALHALRRVRRPLTGLSVAIFGAGPIGLTVAQWARIAGASTIVLFDIVAEKLALARGLGFAHAIHADQEDVAAVIGALTAGAGAHVCVDAAGFPATTLNAIRCTRRGGDMVLLGNPAADVTLPAALISQAMRREIALLGTWNSDFSAAGNDDDWSAAVAAMASGALDLEPLVTHRPGLDDALPALHAARDRTGFVSRILVMPHEPGARA